MRALSRKRVPCSVCRKKVWVWEARKDTKCHGCQLAKRRAWYLEHKAVKDMDTSTAWRAANRERARAVAKAYRDKNKARLSKYRKKWRAKQKAKVLQFPPLCPDCSQSHSSEQRLSVLRRMDGFSPQEIREAYPCIWGTEHRTGGENRFFRDRQLMREQMRRRAHG